MVDSPEKRLAWTGRAVRTMQRGQSTIGRPLRSTTRPLYERVGVMSIRRELLPHGGRRLTRPSMAAAPANGFDYPATQVGTSGNVAVYYDPALGTQGLQLATSLVGAVTTPYRDMEAFFGIQGSAVTLIVAPLSSANDGSGGAYHYGCDFTTGNVLYVDATFANSQVNPLDLE